MRWIVTNLLWRKQLDANKPKSAGSRRDAGRLGELGEDLAARFIERIGYRIVARNVRVPIGRTRTGALMRGELDIVAFDGESLVFIEVKTRSSDTLAAPESAVDEAKKRRLMRAALRYRRLIGPFQSPFRFDVVSVVRRDAHPPEIQLFKDFLKSV